MGKISANTLGLNFLCRMNSHKETFPISIPCSHSHRQGRQRRNRNEVHVSLIFRWRVSKVPVAVMPGVVKFLRQSGGRDAVAGILADLTPGWEVPWLGS